MKPLYPWMGGKYYEKDVIIPLIPEHKWYVEPFFGSGVLLLNKPKSMKEFANDKFSCLVACWEVIKDPSLHKKMEKMMERTLDSTYLYKRWMKLKPEKLTLLDRAYRFLYLVKFGFNSFMNTHHTPMSHGLENIKNFALTWRNTRKRLPRYYDRIKDVMFSNYDFRRCLDKIKPHPKKFILLDPPYVDTHSYDEYYDEAEKGEQIYYDMREKLEEQTKGGTKWMITCSPKNEFFDSMRQARVKFITRRACINRNKEQIPVQSKIVLNYDPQSYTSCVEQHKDAGDFLEM